MLLILSTGIVFVCFPALTSRIANTVGVGRGTDLLLYVSLISIGFLLTLFYSKIRVMSQTITHLTRAMALREVRKGGTGEEDRK